nr:MAG TPA: NikA, BACTERIAL CONJUGATION, RELAXASE, DNA [Caudoviricetes sp.]
MGRPYTAGSPKTNNYRIRMTDEELRKLELCCERTGLSKADVIRLGIDKVYMETEE